MADDHTHADTPLRNPVVTGDYVPDATPDAGSTQRSGPHPAGAAADLPDIPGYAVTHELARGGMGRVLAATDLGFGREVAVKVLLPGFDSGEAAGRFVREARITGRLTHPGIPPAHHLGALADGSPFLAMKLVRGRTLAALLADRPTPAHDLPRFVGVVEQICQAVGFAHSEGVVHRDLKPANVMVGAFGEVQVMDWGLAFEKDDGGRMKDEADPDTVRDSSFILHPSSLTAQGAVMGTPAYMAPEQARGEPVDARADVFALGGVLCEVLTGRRPFVGKGGPEALRQAAAGDVVGARARLDACGADAELVALAKRCLSPACDDRPFDGTAVATEVAAYRAGVEDRLRAAERDHAAAEARAAEQGKRRKVQLAVAALLVVLVAGAGGVAVWRVREAGDRRAEAARLEGEERARKEREAEAVTALLDRAALALAAENADLAEPLLDQADRRARETDSPATDARHAAYRADQKLLKQLAAVENERWTPVNGRMPGDKIVVEKYLTVLARYGVVPGRTPTDEAVRRINGSTVRASILAALDGCLVRLSVRGVGELLDAADGDPFRVQVRAALANRDRAGLEALANRTEWSSQPAGLIQALVESTLVPRDAARGLLTRVSRDRPDDFGVLIALGSLDPVNTPDGAANRLRWVQAALALRPTNASAQLRLGSALIDSGDLGGAIAAYDRAARLSPGTGTPLANLGVALHRAGDLDRAVFNLREAVRLDPEIASAHTNLGAALRDKGDLSGAIAAHREAVRLDPDLAQAHTNLGAALKDKGDVRGAIAASREAVRLNPRSAAAHNNLGMGLREVGDLAGACAAHREAVRLDPKDANNHLNLGLALARADDPGAAAESYREAIRLDPKTHAAHGNLGNLLSRTGDKPGAVACHREAVRLQPQNSLYQSNLALALRDTRDLAGALDAIREAVRLDPKSGPAHLNLGLILRDRGDAAGALDAVRAAVRLAPNDPRPHSNLGAMLAFGGDPAGAVVALREAVRVDPSFGEAYLNLGVVLQGQGDAAGAIDAYRAVVRLAPNSPAGHTNLGILLGERGDLDGALAAFRAAVRVNPTDVRHHVNLGLTLVRKGDPAGATACFREAVRLNPKDPFLHNTLGTGLDAQLDLAGAEAAYLEATRLNPRYAPAHANLGEVYRKLGRPADAVAAYRTALALQPTLGFARAGLNYCLRVQRGEVPTAPPPRAVGR